MKKTLKILAITSMLAIVSQSVAFAATQNVNTTATIDAGSLLVTANGTSTLRIGALAGSPSVCSGDTSPTIDIVTITLCSNIENIVVTDLRSTPVGWSVTTQLKHLTYKENTLMHMDYSNSGAVANISGVSPFDVGDNDIYTGNHAHYENVRRGYTFKIHTGGVRTGESGTTGKYIMYTPDGIATTSAGIAIPSNGNVTDNGLTFNFANVDHQVNDMYFADVDSIHMFDRAGGRAIATNTKFRPGTIATGSTTIITGVTAGSAEDSVDEKSDNPLISEILTIMSAVNGAGKGQFTIAVGLETGLFPNSSASSSFTAAIVITVA